MSDLIDHIRKAVKFRSQENLFVRNLDIQFEEFTKGHAVCSMVMKAQFLNQYHNGQGGCLMSLADNTMGTACCYLNDAVTTVDLQYHFMRAVKAGEKAVCTADVLHAGRKVVTVKCKMEAGGRLVGYGTSTFYRLGTPLIPEGYDPKTYRDELKSLEKKED